MKKEHPAVQHINTLSFQDVQRMVAVVGAGPSGIRAVEWFLQKRKGFKILWFEREPTLGGQGAFGIPPVGHQLALKRSILNKGFRALRGLFGSGSGVPAVSLSPDVEFFPNTEVGKDFSIKRLEEKNIPTLISIGSDRPRNPTVRNEKGEDVPVPGRDLAQVVMSTDFFKKINSGWLKKEHVADIRYEGKDFEVTPGAIIYGGGNVASDAAMQIVEHHGLSQGARICYRGAAWAMYNMAASYRKPLGEANVKIIELVTLERYEDRTGKGRLTHVVFRKHRITGVRGDKAGMPRPLIDGNTDRAREFPDPKDTMEKVLQEKYNVTLEDETKKRLAGVIAEQNLKPNTVFQPATRPTEEFVAEEADLAVECIGNSVSPFEDLSVSRTGALQADRSTGRVPGRLLWVSGQALTQRGAVSPSFKTAVTAVDDIEKFLTAEGRIPA